MLDNMRFWLERGVDGFRLDTVNFYFHSLGLENNPVVKPEDFNASTAPAVNPYNFQEHLYDKSQPENLAFLQAPARADGRVRRQDHGRRDRRQPAPARS